MAKSHHFPPMRPGGFRQTLNLQGGRVSERAQLPGIKGKTTRQMRPVPLPSQIWDLLAAVEAKRFDTLPRAYGDKEGGSRGVWMRENFDAEEMEIRQIKAVLLFCKARSDTPDSLINEVRRVATLYDDKGKPIPFKGPHSIEPISVGEYVFAWLTRRRRILVDAYHAIRAPVPCLKCEREIAGDLQRCPFCHADQRPEAPPKEKKFPCPGCKKKILGGLPECPGCGKDLRPDTGAREYREGFAAFLDRLRYNSADTQKAREARKECGLEEKRSKSDGVKSPAEWDSEMRQARLAENAQKKVEISEEERAKRAAKAAEKESQRLADLNAAVAALQAKEAAPAAARSESIDYTRLFELQTLERIRLERALDLFGKGLVALCARPKPKKAPTVDAKIKAALRASR